MRRLELSASRLRACPKMHYLLHVLAGPDAGLILQLQERHLALVGRGQGCDLRLRDPGVSRIHCRILVEGNRASIVDAGSRWGTVVNGAMITRATLKPGDAVVLGMTHLRFESTASPLDMTVEPRSVSSPAPGPRAGRLRPGERQSEAEADEAASPLEALVGKKLLRFQIETVVARGRTGIVFRASDPKREDPVALKVLWPEIARRQQDVDRFVRAIKSMRDIHHPNLVELYAAGKTRSHCWLACEFVDGENLTRRISRVGVAGMLDWRNALRVALDIAHALECAHEHKVVHRNITPNNILITKDGTAKLGDLMLAKALEGTLAEVITRPGEIVGELPYLAPEQLAPDGRADQRSDLYAVGATLYALLTGRPPFSAVSPAKLLEKIQAEAPLRPTQFHLAVPPQFEDLVLKLLAKSPDERFESATKLIRQLERIGRYADA